MAPENGVVPQGNAAGARIRDEIVANYFANVSTPMFDILLQILYKIYFGK